MPAPGVAADWIGVDMTKGTVCTIQLWSGEFCDLPADERIGYPVCSRHARHIFRDVMLAYEVEGSNPYRRVASLLGYTVESAEPTEPVVYYLLVDGLVKIGRTGNLDKRLRDYPPTASVLAVEPGGKDVEAGRHAEFREYLTARREWFLPGPRLREHIESLPTYQAA